MNIAIMQLKNKLAESKSKLKDLEIKASGGIILVRNYLNPYEDDVTLLETEKALAEVKSLNDAVSEIRELKVKIQKLQKELGV